MEPTLDECNAALDEIEEMYDFGRDLRIRIMQDEDVYYLGLTWYREDMPTDAEVYPPFGWITSRWWVGEDKHWHTNFFKV